MPSRYIPLARRFTPLDANSAFAITDQDYLGLGLSKDLAWPDLLARRRVVVLAEASAGKSREFQEQRAALADGGKFAFFITLEALAATGFDGSLNRQDGSAFEKWLASGEEAWFFLDSVDEARINRRDVEVALNRFAREIDRGFDRAHVLLSCRGTVWDGADDLALVRRALGIPTRPTTTRSADDALFEVKADRAVVEEDKMVEPDVTVVALNPLNLAQRATYLVQSKVKDVERFEQALFLQNLNQFAQRPGDLAMLVRYWLAHRRFDGLREMMQLGIITRLEEVSQARLTISRLSLDQILAGAERLAAAMTLERTMDLLQPDRLEEQNGVDPFAVLMDWPPAEVEALLQRGLFVPSTEGLVRFFHRSAQEYLTAGWFSRMGDRLTDFELLRVFESEAFGVATIPPSLRAASAWLALDRPVLRNRILEREPIVLLQHGDPAKLSLVDKERLLKEYACRQHAGEISYARIDARSLWMFAQQELAPAINAAMTQNANRDFQYEMLTLIEQGRIFECRAHARATAADGNAYKYSRIVAARALKAIGDAEGMTELADALLRAPGDLEPELAPHIVEPLFPDHLTVEQLLRLVSESTPAREHHTEGFAPMLPDLFERCRTSMNRLAFLAGVADLADVGPFEDWPQVSIRYRELLKGAGPLAAAAITAGDAAHHAEVVRLLAVAERIGSDRIRDETPKLEELVPSIPELNRALFWKDVRIAMDEDRKVRISSVRQILIGANTFWRITERDRPWIEEALTRPDKQEAAIALSVLVQLARAMPDMDAELARLEGLVAADPQLSADLSSERPPETDPEWLVKRRTREAEQARTSEAREEARRRDLVELRDRLQADPSTLNEVGHLSGPMGFRDLRLLTKWLAKSQSTSFTEGGRHWRRLEEAFGPVTAAAYREGMTTIWKVTAPEAPKVDKDGRRTVKHASMLSEAGLALDAEQPGWAAGLTSELAQRAVEHAFIDDFGIPAWLGDVIDAHPAIVTPFVLATLDREWSAPAQAYRPLIERFAHTFPIPPAVRSALLDHIGGAAAARVDMADSVALIIGRLELDDAERLTLAAVVDSRIDAFLAARQIPAAVSSLAGLFVIDPDRAAGKLEACIKTERRRRHRSEAHTLMRGLFSRHRGAVGNLGDLSVDRLAHIIRAAYRERDKPLVQLTARGDEDGYVADRFDEAGGSALSALIDDDGEPAFTAMVELAKDPAVGSSARRLRELAHQMAERQSEKPAWPPAKLIAFEASALAPASTGHDLFQLISRLLADIAASFQNLDMSAQDVVETAPDEAAVQNWLGNELNLRSGGRFHAHKEPQIVHNDRPDILISSSTSSAELAIEIKHGGKNWTFPDLAFALSDQLATRYLRTPVRRHGILVISNHRETRYWRDKASGVTMRFPAVIDALKRQAETISANDTGQIEVGVCGIDASARRSRRSVREGSKSDPEHQVEPGTADR
ncbi:NACHT domain-containing protein [Sphingomonas faeni]|uniref:NACHT domain-containing protein n=1 Tax=Sphingomonas faeni TaxID=185950 RepID=UPI00334DD957